MILLKILLAMLLLILAVILFLVVCSLFVNPKREYDKNSRFYRFLLDTCTAVGLWLLRIKVTLTGAEKLPQNTRFLLVSNHLSNYDPIVTWYALKPYTLAFVSKKGNFRIPVFGRFIRKCCFMAIDRENPRNAMRTIHKAADLLLTDEASVCVYPEGTRNKTADTLLPFHNGVFKIAKKAGVPLVTVSVSGTGEIHKNIPFRKTEVSLKVLDVLPADRVAGLSTAELGAYVRQLLENDLDKGEKLS